MSLAALAKGRPPAARNRRQKCSIGRLLASLPETEADGLETLLADNEGWPGAAIAVALIEEGRLVDDRPVKGNTIQRHRRGECSCDEQEPA